MYPQPQEKVIDHVITIFVGVAVLVLIGAIASEIFITHNILATLRVGILALD